MVGGTVKGLKRNIQEETVDNDIAAPLVFYRDHRSTATMALTMRTCHCLPRGKPQISVPSQIHFGSIADNQQSLSDAEPSIFRLSLWPASTFFKSNRLPQFSSGLFDIWIEMCTTILLENFAIGIFQLIFNLNNKLNWDFEGFWQFFYKCLIWTMELGLQTYLGYFDVCVCVCCVCVKNGPSGPNFRTFLASNGTNKLIDRLSYISLKCFQSRCHL